MTNKENENIGFYYLLKEIQLYSSIQLKVFDSFGTKYTSQEVFKKCKDKSLNRNILIIQSDDYIMCGFYWIALTEYMIPGKTLLDYVNLLSPNNIKRMTR